MFSGSVHGPLVRILTQMDPDTGVLTCTFPDGTTAIGPTDQLAGSHVTDFYGRDVPGHIQCAGRAQRVRR